MGEKAELRVFTSEKDDQAVHGDKGLNDVKQSGCRLALKIAIDNNFTANDVRATQLASAVADRLESFRQLTLQQKQLVFPLIEQFLANEYNIIPGENITLCFIESICREASTMELPPEPHNGNIAHINFNKENEEDYTKYLRLLRKKYEILKAILDRYMSVHSAALRNLSNT